MARIGSGWNKVDTTTGAKFVSLSIESDIGINLPAGAKLSGKLVANDKKTQDNHPDWHLEAWIPKA